LHTPLIMAAFAWSDDIPLSADSAAALAGTDLSSLSAPVDSAPSFRGIDTGVAKDAPLAVPVNPAPLVASEAPRSDSTPELPATPDKAKRVQTVAVLAFTGDGIAPKDLAAITSRFETELLATDSFKVVERRNIERILSEQGFQQSGACDNSECSVQIGQLLSVEGIFTGEVAKVGKTWSLSVKRTDVGSGQTLFSHVLDIQGSMEDVLRGGCVEMSQIASGRKKPAEDRSILVAKRGSLWPWIAGGTVLVGGAVVAAVLLTKDDPGSTPAEQQAGQTESDKLIMSW